MKNLIPECVIAILVVVIGITVIVKIIRFCQRHFPDPEPPIAQTNTLSAALFVVGVEKPTRSAEPFNTTSAPSPSQSCDDCGCDFDLGFLAEAGEARIAYCGVASQVSRDQFMAYLSDLHVPQANSSNISYSGGVLTVDGGGQIVIVEASSNLQEWTPVLTNNVPPGRMVQATVPGVCSAGFFRLRL